MLKTSQQKFLLIISGSVSAGKSTTGKFLKEYFARTAVFDMDIIKWQISDFKRGDEDNAIIREGVLELARNYCKHGINIIIPQTMEQEEAEKYKKLAEELKYTYIQVELYAQDNIVMKRALEKRKKTSNPSSNHTHSPNTRILRNIAWYKKTTDPEVKLLDTSNLSIDEVNKFVLNKILEKIKTN